MDPQAAWDALIDAYDLGEWSEVREFADGLLNWLQAGGFPPKTRGAGHDMDDDWNRAVALAACQVALGKAAREDAA